MLRAIILLLVSTSAANADEVDFARSVLSDLQARSFAENVEYCGYIGLDNTGAFVASEAEGGGADWCDATLPEGFEVTASYHTHGSYDPESWAEIPSGTDMEGDEAEGIDGYVSTPGGRFWYIDTEDMVTFQICGIGCLPQDPRFVAAPEDNILESYSYEDLVEKIDE